MTDALQGEEDPVLLAKREYWRPGDREGQTWAVEHSALQVGQRWIIF